MAAEVTGFIGYHGDSLDFLIYQDIIRIAVEEILSIPIRKDFHFVSTPLNRQHAMQSLEKLSLEFVKEGYQPLVVAKNTFPLNFTIYANHNRLGLNSIINFSQNIGHNSLSNRHDLKMFFDELGLDSELVNILYDLAYQHLESTTGVLLQFFDTSTSPYSFANACSYASYPNGFITDNRLIQEFFLENSSGEYPQELRLMLNLHGTLNPYCPLLIKRYTKLQPSKLKGWEQALRQVLQASAYDQQKIDELRQTLLQNWKN